MAYDKASNEMGALWAGTSKKGQPYWSGSIDLKHAPETAKLMANALLSGAPIRVMIFGSGFKKDKAPTHLIIMPQEQLDFLDRNYQHVWREPISQQPDYKAYAEEQRLLRTSRQHEKQTTAPKTGMFAENRATTQQPTPPPPPSATTPHVEQQTQPQASAGDIPNPFGV